MAVRHRLNLLQPLSFLARTGCLAVLAAIVATIASTFFYCEQRAVTTMGDFSAQEAAKMGLSTQSYCGWPSIMFIWNPGFARYDGMIDLGATLFANLFSIALFIITLIPNIAFWGSIFFALIVFVRFIASVLKFKIK